MVSLRRACLSFTEEKKKKKKKVAITINIDKIEQCASLTEIRSKPTKQNKIHDMKRNEKQKQTILDLGHNPLWNKMCVCAYAILVCTVTRNQTNQLANWTPCFECQIRCNHSYYNRLIYYNNDAIFV